MQSHIGTSYSDSDVKDYLWSTLRSGRVVPGYGHGVLRKPDPRFETLMAFASSRPEIAKDPLFQLVRKNSEIAPVVLKEHGKVSSGLHTNTCNQESACANTSQRQKIPILMSTLRRASSSTTTVSTRLCTTRLSSA